MKKAFTLLELIVVIIIVGVLTSIALPKISNVIEKTRGLEAINAIGVLRRSYERCSGLSNNPLQTHCRLNVGGFPDTLDVEDPGDSPGTHFIYFVNTGCILTNCAVLINARRNNLNGGDGTSWIAQKFGNLGGVGAWGAPNAWAWRATGVFQGIKFPN